MKLEELYKEIQPRIYAFFFVKTSSREIAEDLTQEVFYEAIKGMNSFSQTSTIQTWLFAIAKNRLKKYFRSKKYKESLADLLSKEEQNTITPEEQLLKKEETTSLIKQINQLDEMSKEIVTLRIYGELSFKEIGILTEKSENYARITFHRAKLKLQKEMEGYHG
ncbi:RNA polymerase sigma factor [Ferdinandcohnia quinoae]|uniref:Sigma-70 family RNA polymerase sigma factor n=1 Tax=Fredinandcohnia quinoae TaxID=2918902 RepID=A0AAW5DYC1_9BACI|nr:sigma-70 family RNA polymerase sigma factor [Fredinandcohnia sp. SECRCQ15]MCH1625636.1 sigma-70 family RNA polymerase sigma factor [Fredinandcohnia sp. SECRCQ15]